MLSRILVWFPLFFGLWWVLSGYAIPLLLALGFGVAALVALRLPGADLPRPRVLAGFLVYAPWLLYRIVLANLQVARLILLPQSLKPSLVEGPIKLSTAPLRVLFCQSVTLTPGTISIRLKDEAPASVLVHCIDDAAAGDIRAGTFEARIRQLLEGLR